MYPRGFFSLSVILALMSTFNGISGRDLVKVPGYGGPNGIPFDDVAGLGEMITGINFINFTHGDAVDSIQVTYLLANGSLYLAPKHGGNSNTYPPGEIKVEVGEYVERIEGKVDGHTVNQIKITTVNHDGSNRKVYGPYGKNDGMDFSYDGHIIGFYGGTQNLLKFVGVYTLPKVKKSNLFGGPGGDRFDEHPNVIAFPPVKKINKIMLTYVDSINSIQVEYLLLDNSTHLGEKHGGVGNNSITIELEYTENIITLEGESQGLTVDQLSFITRNSKDGMLKRYGPYGKGGEEFFSVNQDIVGFVGFSTADIINTVSVYYYEAQCVV